MLDDDLTVSINNWQSWPTPGKTNVDRRAALYDTFILMLVTVVLTLQAGEAVVQISAP